MFFHLTQFIYPVKRKIALSGHFGFYFDNPKNSNEFRIVRDFIKKSWDLSDIYDTFMYQRFPLKKEVPNDDVITFEYVIENFCKAYFSKSETNKILKETEGNVEKMIDFFARYWVIVRYENREIKQENSKLKEKYKEMKKKKEKGFFLLEDDHIFESRNNQLVDYSYLISLMSGDEHYFGWNFLLTQTTEEIGNSPKIPIMYYIMRQWIALRPGPTNDPTAYQFRFLNFTKKIESIVKLIDSGLKKGVLEEDTIIYLGNILRSSKPTGNEVSSLVRLVGIMEMLLTHQPDFNRFNVEESISKQFVLKTATIIYLTDKKVSLEKLKNDLKEIYTQRSNIVHGNFKEVSKFKKKLKNEERYFSSVVSKCYYFARLTINKYLEDTNFTNFLKNN